jgi:serine/threonine-protein kinase RsbW
MTGRAASEPYPVICLELPAEHRYLSIVSACLAALLEQVDDIAEREPVTYNLQLAIQEACTNIVDHAYAGQAGGRIAVEISLSTSASTSAGSSRRLTVDLYDSGQPFDESQTATPSFDEPQIHGYGLFLMRELTDGVQYERVEDRNHWQLLKKL